MSHLAQVVDNLEDLGGLDEERLAEVGRAQREADLAEALAFTRLNLAAAPGGAAGSGSAAVPAQLGISTESMM